MFEVGVESKSQLTHPDKHLDSLSIAINGKLYSSNLDITVKRPLRKLLLGSIDWTSTIPDLESIWDNFFNERMWFPTFEKSMLSLTSSTRHCATSYKRMLVGHKQYYSPCTTNELTPHHIVCTLPSSRVVTGEWVHEISWFVWFTVCGYSERGSNKSIRDARISPRP